jgi:hypothetical protein
MLPHPSLQCRYLVRSERSLVAWILVVGTLFVAAVTLQYVSIVTEGSSFTRDHARISNHRTMSNFKNASCQRLPHPPAFSNSSLDVVSKIYVISLPRRTDRRLQMDRLRDALHLNWTYMDACEANASVVTTILRQVHVLRSQLMPQPKLGDARMRHHVIVSAFDWPHDLEDTICSLETLQPSGADIWTLPSSNRLSDLDVPAELADPYAFTRSPSVQASAASEPTPLACASGNNVSATSPPNLPPYRHLTAAKVACWYSHLQTIREIANGENEAVLVLEDDVDIEWDVKKRLQALLVALPNDWDMVYLGKSTTNPKPGQQPMILQVIVGQMSHGFPPCETFLCDYRAVAQHCQGCTLPVPQNARTPTCCHASALGASSRICAILHLPIHGRSTRR